MLNRLTIHLVNSESDSDSVSAPQQEEQLEKKTSRSSSHGTMEALLCWVCSSFSTFSFLLWLVDVAQPRVRLSFTHCSNRSPSFLSACTSSTINLSWAAARSDGGFCSLPTRVPVRPLILLLGTNFDRLIFRSSRVQSSPAANIVSEKMWFSCVQFFIKPNAWSFHLSVEHLESVSRVAVAVKKPPCWSKTP